MASYRSRIGFIIGRYSVIHIIGCFHWLIFEIWLLCCCINKFMCRRVKNYMWSVLNKNDIICVINWSLFIINRSPHPNCRGWRVGAGKDYCRVILCRKCQRWGIDQLTLHMTTYMDITITCRWRLCDLYFIIRVSVYKGLTVTNTQY